MNKWCRFQLFEAINVQVFEEVGQYNDAVFEIIPVIGIVFKLKIDHLILKRVLVGVDIEIHLVGPSLCSIDLTRGKSRYTPRSSHIIKI